MTAKVFCFIIAVLFVMQIEANPLYERDFFRRLDMRPRMDEHPDAYIRRRLDLMPMMDETPDEYIARREGLLYSRGLCNDMKGAEIYCQRWMSMCAPEKTAHFKSQHTYNYFTDTLCSKTCRPQQCS